MGNNSKTIDSQFIGIKLPVGWCLIKHKDVAEINPKLPLNRIAEDLKVSFLPMSNIEALSGKYDLSILKTFEEVKKGYTSFINGDLIFAKITPCMENGKIAIVNNLVSGLGFGSTEFHVSRFSKLVNKYYFFYFFNQERVRKEAKKSMTGSAGQLRVSKTYFENVTIPLPPLTEQNRIVAKIEELFSELDKGIESLKKAQEQLKIYRQVVLKHAFEGKLTEKWREQQLREGKLESAESLLEKIKLERERLYQEQVDVWERSVKAWEANGKQGKKPSKPKNNRDLIPLDKKALEQLSTPPKMWKWVKLESLGHLICGQSLSVKEVNTDGKGVLYVTGPEQWNGKYIEEIKWTEYPKRLAPNDSIFITVKGAGVGKLFNGTFCSIGRDIYAFCPYQPVSTSFIIYYLKHTIEQIVLQARGDIPGLSKNHILDHIIGLPSLDEENQIIQEIESRLSICDQLEATITENLQRAQSLRQSILKQAFEGKLVPQDPNDEPAEKLLDRIKKEKNKIND